MAPLSTPGSDARGDVINKGEKLRKIKGKPLINVGMTPLFRPGSVMRDDLNNSREKQKELKGNC